MDSRISVQRERIERVREALARHDAHALLVPSADPHLSEYLPARWQGRQWLSGFTGSMGTLVVTLDQAALFADSRYWVQAEAELAGSGIALVKIPTGAATHHIDWIVRDARQGRRRLMVDGEVLGLASAQQLRAALDKAGIALRTDARRAGRGLARTPRRCRPRSVYEHQAPQAVETRAAAARARARGDGAPRRDAPLRLHRRRHRVDHQPARRRRRVQPGVPGAPAARSRSTATLFVGAGKIDAALAARAAGRRHHAGRLRRRGRRAARVARRHHAAARPAAHHARLSRSACRRRARDRGDQPEHARSRAARTTTKRSSCARRWRTTARRCARSTPGSSRRWPPASASPS